MGRVQMRSISDIAFPPQHRKGAVWRERQPARVDAGQAHAGVEGFGIEAGQGLPVPRPRAAGLSGAALEQRAASPGADRAWVHGEMAQMGAAGGFAAMPRRIEPPAATALQSTHGLGQIEAAR